MHKSRLAPALLLLLLCLGSSVASSVAAAADGADRPAPTTPTPTPPTTPTTPTPPAIELALSGSGFLGLFFTGVVTELQSLGVATRATPVTGTSGGSLVALSSCLGLSPDESAYVATSIVGHCRARRSCAGSLDGAVRAAVALAVDTVAGAGATQEQKDALARDRCAGVATAVITRLVPAAEAAREATAAAAGTAEAAAASAAVTPPAPPSSPPPTFGATEPWHVSDFRGAADLAAAGAASSYIPFYSGAAAYTTFRDAPSMDGGFEEMLPPCRSAGGDGAAACVRVSAVPSGALLIKGLPAPPGDAEIAPGKYAPLPGGMSASQWSAYALAAPDEATGALMLRHGREQARAWAAAAYPEFVKEGGRAGAAEGGEQAQEQQQQQEQQEAAPSLDASPPGDASGARRKARKLLVA